MPSFTRLAVAAVIAVAVGTAAVTQLWPRSGPGIGTQASPTPGWGERFPRATASFSQPFTYALDPSAGIEVSGDGSEIRFGIAGQPGPLVVVQQIDALRLDPCHEDGGTINSFPTPESFVAYMATVPGLSVSSLGRSAIAGRPAYGVDVTRPPNPACRDVYLFGSGDSFTCCWPDDPTWVRRMWAIEVGGRLVVITTPFGATTKDARLGLATALVDSIRFASAPGSSVAPSR